VGKHRSNSQYFKGKKLQSEIFNQLNILKVKSTKIILEKKEKRNEKKGKKESWKKKESNFGKINEKKRKKNESWKKNEKLQKKK
jgi:hypothetical protein